MEGFTETIVGRFFLLVNLQHGLFERNALLFRLLGKQDLSALAINGQNGVGYDRPLVIEVPKAREIVGDPIVVSIAGGDVDAAIDAADKAFTEFLAQDAE